MNNTRHYYLGLVITFIITYATIIYIQAGFQVTLIICGSMIAGLVIWLKTTYKYPVNPKKILPVYLLTLSLFMVHITEEYLGDFSGRIAAIMHIDWSQHQFILLICLIGPMIWILGSIALYYKNPIGNFMIWFIFFGMLVGEPVHLLVFPFLEGGRYHYFPGMWTALLPMVTAIYGIYLIVQDVKEQKADRKLRV